MHRFAKPSAFLKLTGVLMPWVIGLTVITTVAGIYYALFNSPADYQQGETVRIMYVHVPSAWMGLFIYTAVAVCGVMSLIWKHPLADVAAKASAPIGALFTFLCLLTGSLWGKPMWGAWWVWDARLTSMLILLFLYLGHMALSNAFDEPERGGRAAAMLAVVGFINVPIIKFSVDWWNTLHQPAAVIRMDGPTIDTAMLIPLLLLATAFKGYYFIVLVYRVRAELSERRLRQLQLAQAERAAQKEPDRASVAGAEGSAAQ